MGREDYLRIGLNDTVSHPIQKMSSGTNSSLRDSDFHGGIRIFREQSSTMLMYPSCNLHNRPKWFRAFCIRDGGRIRTQELRMLRAQLAKTDKQVVADKEVVTFPM